MAFCRDVSPSDRDVAVWIDAWKLSVGGNRFLHRLQKNKNEQQEIGSKSKSCTNKQNLFLN